jgi:hypothetical protein
MVMDDQCQFHRDAKHANHHVFPNASSFKRETALLPNDGVLPTAGIFTECFEENSCRMVFSYQTRPTSQSLSCTNFWC